MIVDHTHPNYVKKRRNISRGDRYNGAYYYSKEIVKNIIPNVVTDRKWITVNVPHLEGDFDHSIVFIHNNRNPNYYEWLRKYKDVILVCGTPKTAENMIFFGTPIYLPLSVDVKQVERYKTVTKDKLIAFAGRRIKINNRVPLYADILSDMCQSSLLREMARYYEIYAVGRTAIQAKILGCNIKVYDDRYPDPNFWKVIDNKDAAKMLQYELDKIDGGKNV